MAEETDNEQVIHRLFEQLNAHVETRWTYFTLSTTEKLSGIVSNLAGLFSVFVFAVIVLFFLSMSFAWWLGDFIGNRAGGFAFAGLVFVPIAAIVYHWIRPFVREKVIESMLHEEEESNNVKHD